MWTTIQHIVNVYGIISQRDSNEGPIPQDPYFLLGFGRQAINGIHQCSPFKDRHCFDFVGDTVREFAGRVVASLRIFDRATNEVQQVVTRINVLRDERIARVQLVDLPVEVRDGEVTRFSLRQMNFRQCLSKQEVVPTEVTFGDLALRDSSHRPEAQYRPKFPRPK
jgi:hypothetical protein